MIQHIQPLASPQAGVHVRPGDAISCEVRRVAGVQSGKHEAGESVPVPKAGMTDSAWKAQNGKGVIVGQPYAQSALPQTESLEHSWAVSLY